MTESSLDKIIEKISAASGKNLDEIRKLIEEKQDELSGLVSQEGAAYMVGRELGISLLKESKRQLKVRNLTSGLRSVDVLVRVSRVFEPREFKTKDGKAGKVMSIILGDETGTVRMPLWNEEIEKVQAQEGDVLKISRAYVKMDNQGRPELRLGKGEIQKVQEEVDLPEPRKLDEMSVARRKKISDLKEGDFGEVRACLVQVFRRKKPFYEVCPECGVRMHQKDDKWECREHGQKEPDYQMVLSGVLDDGTGNIRCVFFREIAEKVFGKTVKELREMAQKEMDATVIYEKFPSLGREFIFRGRVKKNDLAERPELVVNDLQDVDLKKECQDLLKA